MLGKLETELKLRGYTQATIKAYLTHNKRFLDTIKKEPNDITEEDLKQYLAILIADKKQRPASVHLTISALKFFYETLLKKKIFAEIKPPKAEKKLPTVLTKEEITRMLAIAKNPKHRLLVELLYSSGLRVSEAMHLKINDLDLNEKMGRVISGKGKKDRNIILSERLITSIKAYLAQRKGNSEYMFTGFQEKPLSVRMAQKIVTDLAEKADIKKRVFCHALRSSFATHLLEDGVDIRYIQTLLGHASISTTERYTKVTTEQLKKIRSPLDKM